MNRTVRQQDTNFLSKKSEKARPSFSLRTLRTQLHYLPQALTLVWKAAPGWTAVTVASLVIQGILPVIMVFLTRHLVDSLVNVAQNRTDPALLSAAIMNALFMGLLLLIREGIGSASGYLRKALAEAVGDWMNNLVHKQALALDLQFYESPSYYDQLHRASIDAIDRPLALLETVGKLLQNTITLVAMSGILLTFAWWMPLALLVGTLPALWAALRTTMRFHAWHLKHTIDQRRLSYYHRILSTDMAAAELRLFDLGEHFSNAYRELRNRLRTERLQLTGEQTLVQFLAGLLGLLTLALTLAWTFGQALAGRFSLGSLAMFYQTINQGQQLMRSLLTGVGEIYDNLLFLEDLFTFLELKPTLVDPADPVYVAPGLCQGVRLEGITFQYPDSQRASLVHFNLTIPAGKIVAIVGENGAGKSTLIKLLCRFYDPTEGRITWDGVDLRQMRMTDLRRRITVLFQKLVPYHDRADDNIRFGDLAGQPTEADIVAAAQAGSAAEIIDKLPQGYATVLGRWFGYTELSVGEWQRIALARAFVRQADLIILDEPTSAMDSWTENAWMARFRELVAGRTALMITHRFTTAMQADMIHVMVAGQIVESGSHAELLAYNGRYAQSWRQQMHQAQVIEGIAPFQPDKTEVLEWA
jgi:ATP-binding cassette subfamily B protein